MAPHAFADFFLFALVGVDANVANIFFSISLYWPSNLAFHVVVRISYAWQHAAKKICGTLALGDYSRSKMTFKLYAEYSPFDDFVCQRFDFICGVRSSKSATVKDALRFSCCDSQIPGKVHGCIVILGHLTCLLPIRSSREISKNSQSSNSTLPGSQLSTPAINKNSNWQFIQSPKLVWVPGVGDSAGHFPLTQVLTRVALTALNWEGRGQMICDFFWHLRVVFVPVSSSMHARTHALRKICAKAAAKCCFWLSLPGFRERNTRLRVFRASMIGVRKLRVFMRMCDLRRPTGLCALNWSLWWRKDAEKVHAP